MDFSFSGSPVNSRAISPDVSVESLPFHCLLFQLHSGVAFILLRYSLAESTVASEFHVLVPTKPFPPLRVGDEGGDKCLSGTSYKPRNGPRASFLESHSGMIRKYVRRTKAVFQIRCFLPKQCFFSTRVAATSLEKEFPTQ